MASMKPSIHPLRRWLFENGLTARQFSETYGISEGYLSECLRGKRIPSSQFMMKVATATEHVVTANDCLGYVTTPAPARAGDAP